MAAIDPRPIVLDPIDVSDERVRSLVADLIPAASSVGVELTEQQAELCVLHLLYTEQVNAYINLTRIVDLHDAVLLHLVDSLTLVPYLADGRTSFVDMGTGAGFPGIPLHVATGLSGALLDSVGKKVKAVNAFIDQLGLDGIRAEHARLESYGAEHRLEFDLVVARALAPLGVLIEYAEPLLAKGGQLLVSKGNPEGDEIEQAERVAKLCGFELAGVHALELPEAAGHRELFDFRKVRKASVKLPRAIGEATKKPLG